MAYISTMIMFRRLQKQFFKERQSLLRARSQNGSASALPFTFREDTAGVRTGDWTTTPTPKPLSMLGLGLGRRLYAFQTMSTH